MYKILVVDDEPKIREVIKEYAEFSGYDVTEAEDGMSAIGLCKLNDYDLIVMDVMMPKLDGFSACKEIKKIKDIPVIMLSARGEEYEPPPACIEGRAGGKGDALVGTKRNRVVGLWKDTRHRYWKRP